MGSKNVEEGFKLLKSTDPKQIEEGLDLLKANARFITEPKKELLNYTKKILNEYLNEFETNFNGNLTNSFLLSCLEILSNLRCLKSDTLEIFSNLILKKEKFILKNEEVLVAILKFYSNKFNNDPELIRNVLPFLVKSMKFSNSGIIKELENIFLKYLQNYDEIEYLLQFDCLKFFKEKTPKLIEPLVLGNKKTRNLLTSHMKKNIKNQNGRSEYFFKTFNFIDKSKMLYLNDYFPISTGKSNRVKKECLCESKNELFLFMNDSIYTLSSNSNDLRKLYSNVLSLVIFEEMIGIIDYDLHPKIYEIGGDLLLQTDDCVMHMIIFKLTSNLICFFFVCIDTLKFYYFKKEKSISQQSLQISNVDYHNIISCCSTKFIGNSIFILEYSKNMKVLKYDSRIGLFEFSHELPLKFDLHSRMSVNSTSEYLSIYSGNQLFIYDIDKNFDKIYQFEVHSSKKPLKFI